MVLAAALPCTYRVVRGEPKKKGKGKESKEKKEKEVPDEGIPSEWIL